MDDNKKLELINSMDVIEFSASGGSMEYVLVENSEENRETLSKIGMTDTEINECNDGDGYLDITEIGFKYSNYFWERKGFYNK